jgi:hypothetical protein
MSSTQSILTYTFDIFFYFFSILFIFQFLLGLLLPATEEAEIKPLLQPTLENVTESLAQPVVMSVPNSDEEATLQYLEMVGADIDDFESIEEARKFLDENASWTIETPTESKLQVNKLTFEQVHVDFATKGFNFERARSGHNRYRVISFGNPPNSHRFKTLQEAMDWLAVSEPLQTTITNYG